MSRWVLLSVFALTLATGACGGRRHADTLAPVRALSAAEVDSLWRLGEYAARHGKWNDVLKHLDRVVRDLSPDDPRAAKARYFLGEAHMGKGDKLEAAREFRKAVDDTPDAPIAPDALLRVGDAYADLWRRPELDPTYGQSALSTYQELLSRYPTSDAAGRARIKIADLNNQFAYKAYRAALYYYRLKAYDSAILYLKDLVATYPDATITPEALGRLIQAYQKLGYREDVEDTCRNYIRRFKADVPSLIAMCRNVPDSVSPSS